MPIWAFIVRTCKGPLEEPFRACPLRQDNYRTVGLILTECDRLPDLPLTLTLKVPVAAELLTVSVNVLVLVVLLGLNDAVTPLGRWDADIATLPVKPFVGWMVIVDVPVLPRATFSGWWVRRRG
jgi:hypothetical protein